jgi:putative ABC transport system permease protein
MVPQPIRGLVWLLRRLSSRAAADAAVGDVLDDLAGRMKAGHASRWPRLWVNAQALKIAWAFAAAMTPRLCRSGWQMLRDAMRSLRRSPAYSTLVIVLLAVGIAAGTITYSVVDAVVLRPLALEQSDRLVSVRTRDDKFKPRITAEGVRRIRDEVTGFESVSPLSIMSGAILTIDGVTGEQDVLYGTSDLFRVLRFGSTIGRVWTAEDEARGEMDVAVLGYRFWMQRFQGDPNVLGRTIVHGRNTYRVIGVLAAGTDIPDLNYSRSALWVPLRPGADLLGVLGRMRPGVSPARIADEIQNVVASPDWRPAVVPLIDTYVGQVQGWMLLALGAAGLVVLIACVNAASIMLTRAFRRAHELSIRSSLGASRRQIALSVMTEGIVLSVAASVCALLFAVWGIHAAKIAVTTQLMGIFRASTIALNSRVFVAAIGAAIVTGVCSSLVPAWQASRASVVGVLKDAGPTVTSGGRWWRSGLLIAEIACVTVLLVVSWLFVASLIRVVGIDLGVDGSHLVGISPRLPFNGTVEDVRRRLELVPGVTGVAVSAGGASLPVVGRAFGGAWITSSVERTDTSGDRPALKVLLYRVTPNYFDVAGIRFRRGAAWSAETAFEAPSVVLDEWAAAQLFGAENPLGRQIRATEPAGVFTVVGIVPHVYSRGAETVDEPGAYFAMKPSATRTWAHLFVRTSRSPDEMVPVVTEALAPLAPIGLSSYVHAADEAVRRITATRRFNAGLMSAFGFIAMIIGAAGIYGVIAAVVAQQTREIGVRVALGATPRHIRRSVLALAGIHLLAGLAAGLPLAWWISRGFAAYLFQVTPADPSVYVGVAALVGAVGLGAAFLPAHRAARTDPVITLRA